MSVAERAGRAEHAGVWCCWKRCRCFGCAGFMVQISRRSLGKQYFELEGKRADWRSGMQSRSPERETAVKIGITWIFPLDLLCSLADREPSTSGSIIPSPSPGQMDAASLLLERTLGAGCRMLFPGALSVCAAFPSGQPSGLCLGSCSSFFWRQPLEPYSELHLPHRMGAGTSCLYS